MNDCDAVVIGGGFYGCSLALHLAREGRRVLVLEKEGQILQRASAVNQARIHNGYHYPRAILTAIRSRVNYRPFLQDFKEAVVDQFESYYAIARTLSKVTASQFDVFCRRIGAPLQRAPAAVQRLFNPDRIEDVFRVEECAFDFQKLRGLLQRRLQEAGVTLSLETAATRVESWEAGRIRVRFNQKDRAESCLAGRVYNCAYAGMNRVLKDSGLQPIPFKYEITEMALVELPEPLRRMAVTVMCGPFFSFVPFPSRGLHTLSHVRYTPHAAWREGEQPPARAWPEDGARPTAFAHMLKDAVRYLPALKDARYRESLWEVKTLLPKSEMDDSRPILFLKDHGIRNLTCIMGGKIDNVYDMIQEIRHATV